MDFVYLWFIWHPLQLLVMMKENMEDDEILNYFRPQGPNKRCVRQGMEPVEEEFCLERNVTVPDYIYRSKPAFNPLGRDELIGTQTRKMIKGSKLERLPYSAIGLITMWFDDDQTPSYGTGVLIKQNLVLTCGHNCFNQQKGIVAKRMVFQLGLNRADGHQQYQVKKIYYPKELNQKYNSKNDIAVLILKQNAHSKFGYMGISLEQQFNSEDQVEISGYPYQIIYKGKLRKNKKQLFSAKGNVQFLINNDERELLYNGISTSTGQSGSPIIIQRQGKLYVVGVHLGSFRNGAKFGYYLKENFINRLNLQKFGERGERRERRERDEQRNYGDYDGYILENGGDKILLTVSGILAIVGTIGLFALKIIKR